MMKFKNWKDMYNLISKGIDLYNPETETFVSVYNDAGALCTYDISKEEAKTLVKESEGTNESWLAFLGIGGNILDDTYYNGARYLKMTQNMNYIWRHLMISVRTIMDWTAG